MKKIIITILIMLTAISTISQNKIDVIVPEAYELSNIILALTNYGRTDELEVQKNTKYYQEVITFFEPVKNHPLLDSVNYSRERWEDYLSFRTDAFAFQFDENNKLKRNMYFYSVEGHNPFDTHLNLINDFVEKSNFRQFFKEHKSYYDFIINNYLEYNFIEKSVEFLKKFTGFQHSESDDFQYSIVLSPLILRMNCHSNISANIIADFPTVPYELLSQVISENNMSNRLNGNHIIFTELDHGYINPISDKFQQLISDKFDWQKWDNNSGYKGVDVFNEYMTWAVWELFAKENFPEIADSLILQWQYQNASRGFFAHSAFSDKLFEITKNKKNINDVYIELLEWCKMVEHKLSIPKITNSTFERNPIHTKVNIQLTFSEAMTQSDEFGVILSEMKNGVEIGKNQTTTAENVVWTESGRKVSFDIKTEFKEFVMIFNYWGILQPVTSINNILLPMKDYVVIEHKTNRIDTPQNHISNKMTKPIIWIIAALIAGLIAGGVYMFLKK